MSYTYGRSDLLSVVGPVHRTQSSNCPLLTTSGEEISCSLGPPSRSFGYSAAAASISRAEFALSVDRNHYLTFLDSKAPETVTDSLMAICRPGSCNSRAVMMSLSFPILPDGESLQGRILAAFSNVIEEGTNSGGYR